MKHSWPPAIALQLGLVLGLVSGAPSSASQVPEGTGRADVPSRLNKRPPVRNDQDSDQSKPENPLTHVTVSARTDGWIEIPIDLSRGDQVALDAEGRISYGYEPVGSLDVDPTGDRYLGAQLMGKKQDGHCRAAQLPVGCLAVRTLTTSTSGAPFAVGSSYKLVADQDERIELCVNDIPGLYGDNTGSFKVKVAVLHAQPTALDTNPTNSKVRSHDQALGAGYWYINLGNAATDRGDFAEAANSYRTGISMLEAAGVVSLELAHLCTGLGGSAEHAGDLAEAQVWYGRAVAIEEAVEPGSLELASTYDTMGYVALNRHDLAGAEAWWLKVVPIKESKVPGSGDLAYSYNRLGLVTNARGDLAGAEKWYGKVVQLKETLEPGSLDLASAYEGLGAVLWSKGDRIGADAMSRKALSIKASHEPGSIEMAHTYNRLGIVAEGTGDLDAANYWLGKALQIAEAKEPESLDVAAISSNLGIVASHRRDLTTAEAWYRKALQIEDAKAPGTSTVAGTLTNLGVIACYRRDYPLAEELYKKALAILESKSTDIQFLAATYSNLGIVARARQDWDGAEVWYTKALRAEEIKAPNSLGHAITTFGMGSTLLHKGKVSEALGYFELSQSIFLAQRTLLATGEARELLETAYNDPTPFISTCKIALNDMPGAFQVSASSAGRAFADSLALRRIDRRSSATPAQKQQLDEFDRQESILRKLLLGLEGGQASEPRQRLEAILVQRREIESQILNSNPKMASLLGNPKDVSVKDAQKLLTDGELLLQYEVCDDRVLIFALTNKSLPQVFSSEIRDEDIGTLCEGYRAMLASRSSSFIPLGRYLFDRLVRPAKSLIDKSKRVLICPKGSLSVIPFAALITSAPGVKSESLALLLEEARAAKDKENSGRSSRSTNDTAVTSTSTVPADIGYFADLKPLHECVSLGVYTDLLREQRTSTARYDLVAFGDPDYGSRGRVSDRSVRDAENRLEALPRLPGSGIEAILAAQAFKPRSIVKSAKGATKSAFYQLAPQARIVHLACHGLLDAQDPAGSGLALAPEGKDPGLLQAWEIARDARLHADMVVLSACETGLGRRTRNEGIQGLARSFHYAGARTVAVSLWCVDDAGTKTLMSAFYPSLKQGVHKDEALRHAMLTTRKNPRTRHPYYWAPFILDGDWR